MFWLYILQCRDGTLHVGHTDDLDQRIRQHDAGKADSYTAKRKPLKLVFAQEFESRYEALAIERKLKGWSRAKKFAYMAGDWYSVSQLAKGKHKQERLPDASTAQPAAATLSASGSYKSDRDAT